MVYEFAAAAYSDGHRRNLRTYAEKYRQFCCLLNLKPFPTSETQLARYIAFLTLTLNSPKSISNYVSGVKKLHDYARVKLPEYSGFINIVLDGVARVLDHVATQAPPITPQMLKKISAIVNTQDDTQVVIFTAMLIAFYLFLRSSNYTSKTFNSFDGKKQLMRSDLTAVNDIIVVFIKWSKTNQFRKRKLLVPLIRVQSVEICPVSWIKFMIRKIPAPPNAPAFCIPKQGKLWPLTYPQLDKQLKRWISDIGLDGRRHSSHGLRRGGASHAFSVNMPSFLIKTLGDWASDAYEEYIQYDIEARLKAMINFTTDL